MNASAPDVSTSPQQPVKAPIVFLVHGTFADNKMWEKGWHDRGDIPDHDIRAVFRRALGDETIFDAVQWSGANYHTARWFAAADLADRADTLTIHNSGRPLVIVAHSHGGNVALGAIAESVLLRRRVATVCCLATPFLNCEPRSVFFNALGSKVLHGEVVLLIILVSAAGALFGAAAGASVSPGTGLAGLVAGAVIIPALANRVLQRIRAAISHLEKHAQRIAKFHSYDLGTASLHSWRVANDEAASLLQAFDWMTRMVGVVPVRAVSILTVALAILLIPAALSGSQSTGPSLALYMLLACASAPVASAVLAVAGGIVTSTWRAFSFSYGEDLPTSLSCNITTSLDPPAGHSFAPHLYVATNPSGLRHSALYSEPEAARQIATVVAEEVRNWRPPTHEEDVEGMSQHIAEAFAGMRPPRRSQAQTPPRVASKSTAVISFLFFLAAAFLTGVAIAKLIL